MTTSALVKRTSGPLILLRGGIQRQTLRPFSNNGNDQRGRRTTSSSASPSSSKKSGSTFGMLLMRSVSGVLAASGVGFCCWWLLSPSNSAYASNFSSASTFSFPNLLALRVGGGDDDDGEETSEQFVSSDSTKPEKPKYLFRDSYRRRVFFNYEKRIRMRSPPEKVFEYFASYRSPEGKVYMTPADLMRAIVPVFPPSGSDIVREGCLRGEKFHGSLHCANSKFFMLFDTNNDGLISFSEYLFFVTLLSIPESSFTVAFKMFDLDSNGEIELEEFKKVMALMRAYNRQGARHRDGKRNRFKKRSSVESGGLLEYFFGKDGKDRLKHEKFVNFLKDLHDEILRLEFAHYDYKAQGKISAKDFALSMVASADMKQITRFLNRVDELDDDPRLRGIEITMEEFKAFAELRRRLQPLALAIFSYGKVNGLLTKKDFQHAASNVCGVSITDNVVDLIYHVFDSNCDGSLSAAEFLAVLERRQKDIGQPTQLGVAGVFSCWWNCAKSCSFTRILR